MFFYYNNFQKVPSTDIRDKLAADAKEKRTVIIDVGGERFIATREILSVFPATRLGKLMRAETVEKILETCDEFTPGDPPEYFFDRNPDNFPAILNMYRTGTLHTTDRGCALVLQVSNHDIILCSENVYTERSAVLGC